MATSESDSALPPATDALPCPFCGEWPAISTDEHSTIIECNNPECLAPSWCEEPGFDGDDEHHARAIATWNQRMLP